MIKLRAMTEQTVEDYGRVDRSYPVRERFVPALREGIWSHSFVPFDGETQTSMPDPQEMDDVRASLGREDADVFLAYDGSLCVGALALRIWWNGCAYIQDIGVSPSHRGRGVAQMLMERAFAWTRRMGRNVLMLETSDCNARACRFYLRQGFSLCGADSMLYELTPSRGQTALFWYKHIDPDKGGKADDAKD